MAWSMFLNSTDRDWERFGKEDPYFGVITDARFHVHNLTDELKVEFFASGQRYVETLFQTIQGQIDAGFDPQRAVDFGCGVGRLVIPLAERIPEVIGVDVSDAMLAEAARNCQLRMIENVTLVKSDDELSRLHGNYDFIHSLIVFQHIPERRGKEIFDRLLAHLVPGGVCVVHFTYAKQRHRHWVTLCKRYVPLARNIANLVKGRSYFSPNMQMNSYDLNGLVVIIQRLGVQRFHSEFTDHGGELGVVFYFQKPGKNSF